jgi:hypothetical protein
MKQYVPPMEQSPATNRTSARLAWEERLLRQKQARYAKRGWKLSAIDTHAVTSLDRYHAGEIDAARALRAIDGANRAARLRRQR